jgi:uncharacterized protein YkwD
MNRNSFRLMIATLAVAGSMMAGIPAHAQVTVMYDGQAFDPEYYAQQNPDVVKAFGTDKNALYAHYQHYGKSEGRLPFASTTGISQTMTKNLVMPLPDGGWFDPAYYAENNPDVVKAVGADPSSLYYHYLEHGKAEGRKPNATSNKVGVPQTQDEMTKKIIALVNEARKEAGVSALSESAALDNDAKTRAAETSQLFSHTRPDGSAWWTLDQEHMYGENIAAAYSASAERFFKMWMNSKGHRENILSPDFRAIGVGYYIDKNGKCFAVQNFGI